MIFAKWSVDALVESVVRLLDDGWDAVGYWFNDPSRYREGFVIAGRNNVDQARHAFQRIQQDGGSPFMRYHVSIDWAPPIIEHEICRVSKDGFTAIASDFTGLALQSVHLRRNTLAEVEQEERGKCIEILHELIQLRGAYERLS